MSPRALKIAAIDDDPVDRMMVRRLLEQDADWRIDAVEFSTGADAIAGIPGAELDVILLDFDLGATDGLSVLRTLKEAGVDTPIVALTGQGDDAVAVELLKAGASDYLPKSRVSTASLQRAITNAIEKQSLRRAVQRYRENLEQRNAELEAQKCEIEAFYHTLSHELKTPLTSVREFICLISEGVAGPVTDEQQEYLGIARRGCDQLKRLMNDLIDLSRLDTGKFSIACEDVEVDRLLTDVVKMEEHRAADQSITLVAEECSGLVRADRERVKQVLTNLIDNALKFTPDGGTITISAEEQDEESMVISVRDTGRGIPPEELERIFERHHQTRREDSTVSGGMGLGLSLCRQLIELHGGKIWIESVPGEGSTFSFTLPVVMTEAIPA